MARMPTSLGRGRSYSSEAGTDTGGIAMAEERRWERRMLANRRRGGDYIGQHSRIRPFT